MRVPFWAALGLSLAGIAIGWTFAIAQQPKQEAKAATSTIGKESPLATLDWIVGDWENEGGDRSVEFNCHFTKNGSFLIRSFKIVSASDNAMSGLQVIAWIPKNLLYVHGRLIRMADLAKTRGANRVTDTRFAPLTLCPTAAVLRLSTSSLIPIANTALGNPLAARSTVNCNQTPTKWS